MKKIVCLCFMLLSFPLTVLAADDAAVRKHAFSAPDDISQNMNKLTRYLIQPFHKDYDRLKVIAYWMASHLAYDSYKYNNDKVNDRNSAFKYDILKAKAGVCEDFAKLYKDMARIAGVDVNVVTGYVVDTPKLKKHYNITSKDVGHAWNEVKLKGRTFYVDTTWMAAMRIGADSGRRSGAQHKREIRQRRFAENPVDANINTFYFDFTPETEVEKFQQAHWDEHKPWRRQIIRNEK